MAPRRIDVGEVRLAVSEAGDPAGEPVRAAARLPRARALAGGTSCRRSPSAGLPRRRARTCAATAGRTARRPWRTTPRQGSSATSPGSSARSATRARTSWATTGAAASRGGSPGNAAGTVRSLTILNAPAAGRCRRACGGRTPRQRAKSWYMLLFQFPGVAEAWLSATTSPTCARSSSTPPRRGRSRPRSASAAVDALAPRRRPDRGAQLVPGEHAALVVAARPARPAADHRPDA